MGFRLSWMAFKDKSLLKAYFQLGLTPTGNRVAFPEGEIYGAELQNDWTLILASHSAHGAERFDSGEANRRLSRGCEMVFCYVSETNMFSMASCWKNGAELWSVIHNGGELGLRHMETSGQLPEVFSEICISHEKMLEDDGGDDSEVDYLFDAPIELARSLTGFRHDKRIDLAGSGDYSELKYTFKPQIGLWFFKMLFQRKKKAETSD